MVPAWPSPTSTPAVRYRVASSVAKRVPIMPSAYSTAPSTMVRPDP
ncbi:Uncharacterised protein [Bordetella pertussis]|nr:Uncharacterised protein [Bordetella pertussis]CFP65673.1 Uncharacterised protein [Bordetella pertussis]CFW10844.1 Uncharacterised protein [Bordetella pertussis]CFW40091.1 Uncharacterised protein [Bordetella pertussis]